MKRNDLQDMKNLDIKALSAKAEEISVEISSLVITKNTSGLKDLKQISRLKKDRAQILTVKRQKSLLEELEAVEEESRIESLESSEKTVKNTKAKTKKGDTSL